MKKIRSQIAIGLVCLLLGFMITYQFKVLRKQNANLDTDKRGPEIIVENEQLKKQKEELEKKINEITKKSKEYEQAVAGKDEQSTLLLKELEETRILTGGVDVEGEGIIIYITPKSNIFGSSFEGGYIYDIDLVDIINALNSVDAEAISINDIRLTSRTGIRNAGQNALVVNNERIPSTKRVTIKAIGSKNLLEGAVTFHGAIPETLATTCDIKIETSDKIKIPKYNKTYEFEYAKPVKEK